MSGMTERVEIGEVDERDLVPGGLEVHSQQRRGPAVQLTRRHDRRRSWGQGEDRCVESRHARRHRDTRLGSFELGDGPLQEFAIAVGVAAVVVAVALAAHHRLVVVEIGEHVHGGRAQLRCEGASGLQFAARVNGKRGRLHRSLVRPA